MWVQEHDQASVRKCFPDRIKSLIIQALSYPPCAHDDALQMPVLGYLLDGLEDCGRWDVGDEWEEPETVKPA